MASTEISPLHYEYGSSSLKAKTAANQQVMSLAWGENFQKFSWISLSSQGRLRAFVLDTPSLVAVEGKYPEQKQRASKDYLKMKFGEIAVTWRTQEYAPPGHSEISLNFEGAVALESLFLAREFITHTGSSMISRTELDRFMAEGAYPVFMAANQDFIPKAI